MDAAATGGVHFYRGNPMRKLMWFSIGFAVSCALGAYIFPKYFMLLGVIALLLGIGLVLVSKRFRFLRILAAVLIAMAVGAIWFLLYDSFALSSARVLDSTYAETEMEVSDYSAVTDYGCTVSANLTRDDQTYHVIIYLREVLSCSPGDVLRGNFNFRFTATGGAKDPSYHRGDGVFLLAYPEGEITHIKADCIKSKYYPQMIRMQLIQRIEALFPKDAAAFAKALLLGDRSGIDYETNTAFKVSGISHIVAVSGLHVSILMSFAALFLGKRRILLFLIGIPTLILFAAITGFSPSVIRACIMQGLFLTAMLIKKEYDPPTALGLAALVMLVINPMVIISVSFQLSFACMIGIFLFSGRIYAWITDEKRLGSTKGKNIGSKLKRWFARSVSVSLGASVLTTPLVAVYFGTISLVSVLTNLLVVWLVAYIFYGILLACGVSLLSLYAGRTVAWLTVYPIRFLLGTSKLIASFPLAAVYTESIYIVVWLAFSYVLLAVFLYMKRKPVLIFTCLSAVSLCICLVFSWIEPLMDPCRLTVLDVGQGQCILLQSDGKTFLVDCGGSSDWNSADKASETLLSQGISRLDGVIVTHYDEDHAGGVPYLLTRVPSDAVYLPYMMDDSGISRSICEAAGGSVITVSKDISLQFGETNITIFGPESYYLRNESSLCVLFQRKNCDILITGDRGSLGEMLLMHRTELPELDVLIAGHHGSAGSTGEDLLEQTNPEYVFISVGRNNRYRHPSEKLLERLAGFGCIVYRTDFHGTIIYRG